MLQPHNASQSCGFTEHTLCVFLFGGPWPLYLYVRRYVLCGMCYPYGGDRSKDSQMAPEHLKISFERGLRHSVHGPLVQASHTTKLMVSEAGRSSGKHGQKGKDVNSCVQ